MKMNFVTDHRGFSSLQVIAVFGLLAGVALYGVNVMKKQQARTVDPNLVETDVTMVTNTIRTHLEDPATCLAVLGTSTSPTEIVGQFFVQNHPSAPKAGYGNSHLQITSFRFSAGGNSEGFLSVNYQHKGQGQIQRKIRIHFTGTLGALSDCRATSDLSANQTPTASEKSSDQFWQKGEGNNNDIFYLSGNVGIGTKDAQDVKLEVAGTIRAMGANLNENCTRLGAQAYQNGVGAPLYCDGSFWRAVGSNSNSMPPVASGGNPGINTVLVEGNISACKGVSIANCPPGYVVVGGGYNFNGGCDCKSGEDTPFVTENRPVANSWRSTMECAQNTAYAICLKQ